MKSGDLTHIYNSPFTIHHSPFTIHHSPFTFLRRRSSMESEHLATNEKVEGSSPSVFTNFQIRGRMQSVERSVFQAETSGFESRLPYQTQIFRVRLTGRTAGSEPVNRGSNPLPEANFYRAFRRRLYGLVLETSVRRFKSCRSDHFFARVAKSAKASVLESEDCGFESHPVYHGDECKASSDQLFTLNLAGSSPVVPSIPFRA